MSWLVIAPLLVVVTTAVCTLALGRRPRIQRAASVSGAIGYVGTVSVAVWTLVLGPAAPGAAAYQVGDWPAPFGITLVLDGLSAFMLTMAAGVGIASILFSVRYITPENQRVYYHPLFHLLLAGVTGAFLTGDLFNLFVWFEVMLIVSYVFVAFYGTDYATAASFRYLVMNVFGSALMLVAIGGLYATTGTLNMADMARRLATPDAYGIDPAPVVGLSALLLAVFALKSGLVPFQFWCLLPTPPPRRLSPRCSPASPRRSAYTRSFASTSRSSPPRRSPSTCWARPPRHRWPFSPRCWERWEWRASSSAGSAPSVRTDSRACSRTRASGRSASSRFPSPSPRRQPPRGRSAAWPLRLRSCLHSTTRSRRDCSFSRWLPLRTRLRRIVCGISAASPATRRYSREPSSSVSSR